MTRQDGSAHNVTEPDSALKTQFARLRAEREAGVAPFYTTVTAARTRGRATPARSRPALVAAFAVVVPLVTVLTLHGHGRAAAARADVALAREISGLVHWRSPTESLLHNGYTYWLKTTPALHASTILPPTREGETP